MADFNLSASINVQLATNAAKLLRDSANKALEGLSATPILKPKLELTGDLERLFPKDKRKKIPLEVSVSVSNKAAFDKLFVDRKIKVSIDFGKQSTANIDQYTDSLHKLKKVLDSMGAEGKSTIQVLNDLSKAAINANATTANAKTSKKGSRKSKEEAAVEALAKRIEGLSKQTNPGKFFENTNKELKALTADLGGLEALTKRFEGTNKKSASNITKALESTHRAMADIDILSQKLNREGLLNSKTEAQLKGVKDEVLGLLRTLDSSNISAFGTELNRILSPAKSGFSAAIKDANDYKRLLSSLNNQLVLKTNSGADKQVIDSIREKIRLTKELRSQNSTVPQIKANSGFQESGGFIANQENINKALKQVRQSIKTVNSDIRNSAIYQSEGGSASGLKDKVSEIIVELEKYYTAQAKLNSPDSLSNINNAFVEAKNKISNLVKDTKTFDTALQNLGSKKAFFDQEGLTAASAEIGKIRDELYRMVAAGTGINEIGNAFTTMSARVEKIGNDEQKIKRFTFALDRLKASLSFDTDNFLEDFSGVGDAIKKAQAKIDDAGKRPGGFDEREVRSQLAADSLLIRSKDKVNKLIEDSREKFRDNIAQGGAGTVIQKAFVNGSNEFEKSLKALNLTGSDTGRVLKEISNNFESTFKHAKFEAEGGFFGSLSKAAGLAAKRLGAFLVVARGFYAIQNLFLDAGRSVLVLDTEFTKLEQIISKSSPSLEATERSMAKLSGTILNLGKEFGVATEEIAQSADTLAQADITGAKLEKLLEISTKARLGPSFESNIQITEAMISVINQFNVTAGEMEGIIGGISQVSAKYPVEAEGITKAIRRAGGAFAAAKAEGQSYQSSLADFVAGFTIVKSKTREADETLATSLRNIVNRLQKNNIQSFLREKFDVSLLDQQGQFIGFAQSIDLISKKVAELGLKSGDPRFAELVDKLAGQRQSSRLLPLLANAGEFSKIVKEFNNGADSLDKDVSIAFKSIENKILRAKNAVIELFTELGRSEVVKTLVDGFTLFTQVLTGVASALNNVGGLIVALGLSIRAIPAISNISSIIGSYGKIGFLGRPEIRDTRALASITGVRTAAIGGKVPGAPSTRDTEPYYLAKGEYVVQSRAVQHYGTSFFDAINEGKIKFAAKGTSGGNFSPENSGISELGNIFNLLGIHITGLDKVLNDFILDSNTSVNGLQASGKFSNSNKTISVNPNKLSGGLLSHEVGHAVNAASGGILAQNLQAPKELLDFTNTRLSKSSGYSNISNKDKQSEVFADAFRLAVASRSGNLKEEHNTPELNKFFDDLLNNIKNTTGVNVRGIGSGGVIPPGGKPPVNLGGNAPAGGPPTPPLKDLSKSASTASKSLSTFGSGLLKNHVFLAGLGLSAVELFRFAGSSKEANDQVQKLVKAFGAAAAAAILLGQASSLVKGSKFSKASRAQLAEDSKKIGFNSVGNAQGAFGPVAPTLAGQENLSKRQRKAARKAFAESGVSLGSSIPNPFVKPSRLQSFKNFASNAGANIKSGALDISSGIKNNLEGISIAAVAATAALVSFADSVIEAADKTIEESTSEAETLEALRKRRGAQVGKAVAGGAGGAVGGALLGAQLGGPQGALIGAAAGFILGLASQIGDLLENTAIGDAVDHAKEILYQVGVVLGDNFDTILSVVTGGTSEALKLLGYGADSKEKNALKNKTILSGTNFNRFNKDLKSGGGLTPEVSKSFIDGAKKLSEVIGPITKEGVSKFNKEATDPQSERVKATAEKLKTSLDSGTPAQKLALIREADKSGVNIANLLKAIGIAYDPLTAVALDSAQKIEEVFLKMEDNFKKVSDKLSNFNANNEIIGNIASGVAGEGFNGSIPSSVFETLKGGGKVDGLGGQLVNKQLAQLGNFAPQIAKDINTQLTGAQAGSNLKSAIASGGVRNATDTLNLDGQISDIFAKSIKGAPAEVQSQLTFLFEKFTDTVQDDLSNSIINGTVDAGKLAGVVDGFITMVNKGGVDLLQKYSESNAQFKSQLDGVLKKRIDFENKITDLLGKNIDNKKSIQEFRNQASGKSKDLTLAQAGNIDSERQANILRKTGLGGSATVSDIKNRFNDLTRQDPTGANPVIQDMKAGLMTALESIAGGTDVLSASIRDFEKATEEARKNTERLTGALLGTDEELLNTVKGVLAFEKVKGAKNQTEAFLAVNSLDQSSKTALGKRIGETEDSRLLFENKLGIAPNLNGSPQLNKVEGEIGRQSEANNAMAGINANLATQMNTLANAMVANKQTFEQFGMNVNNFGNIANQLSASLTNIPTSVAHTMTVAPIQISFTGTDGLSKLNDSSAALVTTVVNNAINKFASGLQSDNKGLVINNVAAMNTVAKNIAPAVASHGMK